MARTRCSSIGIACFVLDKDSVNAAPYILEPHKAVSSFHVSPLQDCHFTKKDPSRLPVTIKLWEFYSTQIRPSINILHCRDIPFRDRKAIDSPNFIQMHFVFPLTCLYVKCYCESGSGTVLNIYWSHRELDRFLGRNKALGKTVQIESSVGTIVLQNSRLILPLKKRFKHCSGNVIRKPNGWKRFHLSNIIY